jgi:hypothetical protein
MEHRKKRKINAKKEEKRAPRVSSNKEGNQYFERRKIVQLQKSFLM